MAMESIRVTALIHATPKRIYEAWIDEDDHGAMTDTQVTVEPRVGGRHTASDGYIEGTILELEPGRRIVQSWRSLDFPQGAAESRLEVILTPVSGGTEVTLVHSDIPDGQGADYEAGWVEHYFKPMQAYFAPAAAPPRQPEQAPAATRSPAKKVGKKKTTPKKKAAPPKKKAAPPKKKAAPPKKAAPKRGAKPLAKKKTRPNKKSRR